MSRERQLELAENELEYQLEVGNINIPEFNRKLIELRKEFASAIKEEHKLRRLDKWDNDSLNDTDDIE